MPTVVTFKLPAFWWSRLINELEFCSNMYGRPGMGHSMADCRVLLKMLGRQEGLDFQFDDDEAQGPVDMSWLTEEARDGQEKT